MAYPDKINALVDIAGTSTLAVVGHAARHNDLNDALDELKAVLTVPAANTLALAPGGTEKMRIDSAGLITGSGTSLGAWTAYTPSLGGTGWAIGNGTLTGVYCQIGKVINFRARMIAGSTTSFGSGSPVIGIQTAVADVGISLNSVAVGLVFDTSAGSFYATVPVYASTTGVSIGSLGLGGLRGVMNATTPMTWATGDELRLSGTYEAA